MKLSDMRYHAFFAESGLSGYGDDEVLVDWIAKQMP